MACERWCRFYSCNCYVNLLFILALGFSLAIAERGDSYYQYDVSTPERSHNFDAVFKQLVRDRRSPIEPLPAKTDNNTNNTTSVLQPLITSKINSSLENVTYSTDNGTTNSTALPSNTTTPQAKPDILVSQPLNPTTGKVDPVPPHIWANRTRLPSLVKPQVQNGTVNASKPVLNEHTIDDDISINKFDDPSNTTLSQNNITKTEEDTHQYYNSTFTVDEASGRRYWVDLVNHPNLLVNDLLSKSHRRAATVKLSFDFPFYGHMVRNVAIATGGFLYTGEYVHSWLAATQYIAPLMANFDTTLSNDSYVKYADNGTAFTVEWEKVVLQDRANVGEFTFQATLHKNGDIVFVYKDVPLDVDKIQDHLHPVKVGLSDAYIIDRTVFFVRKKTIYEYHRVNFKSQDIRNWTVIYLRALPTCLGINNCEDCLNGTTNFDCKWCPSLNRCSTGTDRHRQEWLLKSCEMKQIRGSESCPATVANATTYNGREHDIPNVNEHEGTVHADNVSPATALPRQEAKPASPVPVLGYTADKIKMGVSGIIGILLVVTLVASLIGWAVYAYRNPHTASGQVLIRYRPSQWSWRRGEARYTAATIHM